MRGFPLAISAVVLLALTASSSAGPIHCSQLPELGPRGFDYSSDRFLPGTGNDESLVADDFVCTVADPITDLHWWGSYWQAPYVTPASDYWTDPSLAGGAPVLPATVTGFIITIYDHVPVANDPLTTPMPFAHPGNPLYVAALPIADVAISPAGVIDRTGDGITGNVGDEAVWRYDVDLAVPFNQTAATTYWLSIQAVTDNTDVQWGWHSADTLTGFNATQGGPAGLWGAPYANPWILMVDKDMAFEVTMPEPLTAGLLGAGLAALLATTKNRKRR